MKKESIKTTTNSSTYKKLRRIEISQNERLCFICSPNGGCNRRKFKHQRNWKKYRKTQYR